MYHLGRLGYDFVATTDDSAAGDLWVNFGSGPVIVEVKSANVHAWSVRRQQLAKPAFFVFVSIPDGCCWLVPGDAVRTAAGGTSPIPRFTERQIDGLATRRLHSEIAAFRRQTARDEYVPGAKGWRVVRWKLKNGEVREKAYRR
jgi:hypothetical protein